MKNVFSISLLVSILYASCTSTQFVSDHLGNVNASQYNSYSMEANCANDINPIMQLRIKNAIEKKLRAKDYAKQENADLLVKYFVKNVSKKFRKRSSRS